ncbi:MAG: helix-turn-helix transcriptional regulator, partial [Caldilineaceae bacterium]
ATAPAPTAESRAGSATTGPYAVATLQERLLAAAAVEVHLAAGDSAAALEAVEALIGATANLTAERVVPRLWRLRGLALAALGRYAEAETDLAAAFAAAETQGRQPLAAQIAAALAYVHLAAGRPEQAQAAAAACHTIAAPLLAGLPDMPLAYPGASGRTLRESAALVTSTWLPPEFRSLGLSDTGSMASSGASPLSARELEVAALVAEGLTNRAIAETLVISERTAERHVANIMTKLGMNTRAQIAAYVAAGSVRR